ncbi:MAG: hypothetical protein ACI4IF_06300 [Acutalibacteraceae bacterium]
MIFSKSKEKELSEELFKNPTNEYRGEPFWALNNSFDDDKFKRQWDVFEEMGIGGAHLHCRTGLDIPYMSKEFLGHIKEAVKYADEKGMVAYLYDEDRWPSGFAGGLVTKDEQYRARCIVFSPTNPRDIVDSAVNTSASRGALSKNSKLLAKYDVKIENGYMKSYKKLAENEEGENVWYAYLQVANNVPWFNNQSYVDTLNPEATKRFIEETHEKYYGTLKEYFGNTIPAIFTDEPQHTAQNCLAFAHSKSDVVLPYTDRFSYVYSERYGEDFFATLPELVWDLEGEGSFETRYKYHKLVSEMFADSYAGEIGKWCEEHGILLTGHLMEEPTLTSQTCATTESMRSYKHFGLPGIDMLCDSREYTTAKQAQSASHQYGREGVLSELYGVTGWDYDFKGHKQQGDWQAVLGITNRVHHLSWYSMEGEAKRDYPASIFYQSPWYKEYKLIETHFARVNTALTRGTPEVKIGVIHPIESFWLTFGPTETTGLQREEQEQNFSDITNWLLQNQLDFDYISESLLPEQNNCEVSNKFKVGKMEYNAVVVPALKTMRRTTLNALKAFKQGGGKVVFLGTVPTFVDAKKCDDVSEFAKQCEIVPFTQGGVVTSLQSEKTVTVLDRSGRTAHKYFYQMRNDGNAKWLFIANAFKTKSRSTPTKNNLTIKIKGCFNVEVYDTITGEIYPVPSVAKNGETKIQKTLFDQDSLLLKLTESTEHSGKLSFDDVNVTERLPLNEKMKYTLSEPNAVLLDRAEYKFDDGEWQPETEVLIIDDKFRDVLGYATRNTDLAQPWVIDDKVETKHTLTLKYTVNSEIEAENVYLAYERADLCDITFNGKALSKDYEGYYVDECILKMPVGRLNKGKNVIEVKMDFNPKTNVEWAYLLGDFGVKLEGTEKTVTEKEEEIPFGDYTKFGMPFYTGNVTYKLKKYVEKGKYKLSANKFMSPLLSVSADGKDMGRIAFEPYTVDLGELEAGEHTFEITAFGHRYNGFGAVHNCDDLWSWHGPNAWRSTDVAHSDFYNLKPMGLLKEAELLKISN